MCSAKDSSAALADKETGQIYSTNPRNPTYDGFDIIRM